MRWLLLNILLFCAYAGLAQVEFTRTVISSLGGIGNASGKGYSVTVGEVVVPTFSGANLSLTQGFQQAPYAEETVLVNKINAFSPNGDGINDTWIIDIITRDPRNKVILFNRWGEEIRRFENYDNQTVVWDGSNKQGNQVLNGTYFYIIELLTLDYQTTGWVHITGE